MDSNEYEYDSSYQEEEGDESGSDEEDGFDITEFVDQGDDGNEGRHNEDDEKEEEEDLTLDTASSRKIEEEEDPERLEEKLKTLEEVFSCVPRVLIKRVLCREDVKGDLNIASQKLQEFQDMESPRDLLKPPTHNPPIALGPLAGYGRSENKGGEKCESQSFQGKRRRRGRRRKKNIENQNETQEEQGEAESKAYSRRNSFDKNEAQVTRGDEVFPDRGGRQGGRVFGGRSRGGWRPRGGFVQSHGDYQENRHESPYELGYGFPIRDYMFQSQRGRGNWRGQWNPPKPQPKPKGRDHRGRGGIFRENDSFFQDDGQAQFTERGRGRSQTRRRRGGSRQGPVGRREYSVSLAGELNETRRSYDELDFSGKEGTDPNRLDKGNRGRFGANLNRGRVQRVMRRSQSPSSGMDNRGTLSRENEGEDSKFERKKLLICGLSESTTNDGVFNFIEAMSGEEVQKVEMSKGKALVTMTEDITNFHKIKDKGEKRGIDSARVTIRRVPVCKSILVSGISDDTTHDAIELYFESPRNNGGLVERVQFKPKSGRAVVVFQDLADMERVLAREKERPHILNKAHLTVRINDLLEDDDDDAFDDLGDVEAASGKSHNTSESQQSEPKAQQLHMVVDPDVMEYVTTTSLRDQLKEALAKKTIEIDWKRNSKTVVLLYRGEDESDSGQSECIEEVQTWLGKFTKRDVKVNKDFWESVRAQLPGIRACFGVKPPLVKIIDDSLVVRIVSLCSDAEDLKEKLKAKLEEIYREETRKTYLKKTEEVPVEHLTLLKKIRFVEKLKEKNNELEIKLDSEAEEIYFEGPQPQFLEATMKFHKQISRMIEKKLSLSKNILEILSSDEGLRKVKCELENNNVEAVFVIDREARIIGTSATHADKAASLVSKLTLEEKVRVDDNSQHLLKTTKWRQLCEQLNANSTVRVHRNNWNDTYVSGFREDVRQAMQTLTAYLDNNCIREEQMKCSSKLVRKYLSELRQDDLRSIEVQLQDYEVKIETGKGDDDFVVWGNKEGIKQVKRKLESVADSTESVSFNVKQPGLRKFFANGSGDSLVTSVAKNLACVIDVQKQDIFRTLVKKATVKSDSSNEDDEDDNGSNKEDEDMEDAVSSADSSTILTGGGHSISWKPGNIQTQQADILVSSQGACSQAIVNAGGQAMRQNLVIPNTGDITVTPGYNLACQHVIHTNCSQWHGGTGDQVLRGIVQKCLQKADELGGASIAFPVIGTGNLNFPPDAASRTMLEETITFCQTNPSSTVKDIRFAVLQQDQALITAFAKEMTTLQSKHRVRSGYTMCGLFRDLRSKFGRVNQNPAKPAGEVCVEVLQGNLCHETTDVIVNINSKDMNMDSAGALSKAVKQAAGQVVQDECYQLGHQIGGSIVVTSGGSLTARHIIHLIPDSADKNHLQQCVEKCLGEAEARGFQSISFPAIGTGAYGLSAADSASLIFQALSNFGANFIVINKVRIVVFQAPMLLAFQQEQQQHPLYSNQGQRFTPVFKQGVAPSRAARQRDLNIKVIKGDLTKENTDAIMNIISTDMNMSNAGDLSKAILAAGGTQIQQECSQHGKQAAGTAVMTGGGNLAVGHIIHIIPGSQDKQHLQTCLKAGLRLADQNNLQTISIPCVGTGGFGLTAAESAEVTFRALNAFRGNYKNLRDVRVVVFQAQMFQEFLLAQQRQAAQVMVEWESDSTSDTAVAKKSRQTRTTTTSSSSTSDHSVKIYVTGKDKGSVGKAVDALKKGFSEACTTQNVENETVSKLSSKQINILRRKAKERDVRLKIEDDVDRIVVRGGLGEVPEMVGEIWHEIYERKKKIEEEEKAMIVSKNIEWSYEIYDKKMAFSQKANGKLEMAYVKEQHTVQISLRADKFVINLTAKTGRGQQNGESITLFRKIKGAEEGQYILNASEARKLATVIKQDMRYTADIENYYDHLI